MTSGKGYDLVFLGVKKKINKFCATAKSIKVRLKEEAVSRQFIFGY